MTFIYLDGHATTPLAPEAEAAMRSVWSQPANAGSPHAAGARAAAAVEAGRASVARLIGAAPSEIVFTSGATEANNLILLGVGRAARAAASPRTRVVVSAIEHKSVLACTDALRREGFEIAIAPVDRQGIVDLRVLAELVNERTLLVSIGAANGELGVLQPVAEVVAIAHSRGALAHSDLAQLAGRVACDVGALDLDYGSLSSHKMYGPVGIGAVYVAAGALAPEAMLHGGGQEGGLRPGTVPAPLVAGFGVAAELAAARLAQDARHTRALAEAFLEALSERQVAWTLNGHPEDRLPGSLNIQLPDVDGQSIVERVGAELAISTGSACHSGQILPSHVLRAISLSEDGQRSSIRVCFGRYNQPEDVPQAATLISAAVREETLAHWTGRPVASGHA